MSEILLVIIAGAVGALLKEILADNSLKLPAIVRGELNLGFIGSIAVGAFVGYAVDGGFLTAAMAGYAGFSVIEALVSRKNLVVNPKGKSNEEIIREIAEIEGVDPELAVKVAKCESSLKSDAINVNKSGSTDRGIFQINDKWHPEVTNEQAFDVEFSAKFFCQAVKNGQLSWWDASKKCWG